MLEQNQTCWQSSSLLQEPLLSPTHLKYGCSNIWDELHLQAKKCKHKQLHGGLTPKQCVFACITAGTDRANETAQKDK